LYKVILLLTAILIVAGTSIGCQKSGLSEEEIRDIVQAELANLAGRTAMCYIAASNAPDVIKAQADYICDGTADEVQIQAAIDDLPYTGGKIHLSVGDFSISSTITPAYGLVLEGEGCHVTDMTLANGANCDMIADTSSFTRNKLWFTVRDLCMDGNKSNNSNGNGINLQPSGEGHYWDAEFIRVFIHKFAEDGFITNDCHGYMISHSPVEFNDGKGIVFDGGSNGVIESCTVLGNNDTNLDVEGSTSVYIIGNRINTSTSSYNIHAGKSTHIIGNDISFANSHGVYVNSYCTIENNRFVQNGGSGVAVDGGDYITVIGNTFLENTHYGVDVDGADGSIVIGNVIQNNVAGEVNAQADTICEFNSG